MTSLPQTGASPSPPVRVDTMYLHLSSVNKNVLAKTEKIYILDIDSPLFITVPGDVDKEVMIEVACMIYLANYYTRTAPFPVP